MRYGYGFEDEQVKNLQIRILAIAIITLHEVSGMSMQNMAMSYIILSQRYNCTDMIESDNHYNNYTLFMHSISYIYT